MKFKCTLLACMVVAVIVMGGCAGSSNTQRSDVIRVETASQLASASQDAANAQSESDASSEASDVETEWGDLPEPSDSQEAASSASSASAEASGADGENDLAAKLRKKLNIKTDFHKEFAHGPKPAKYQKYIVLHDTEGDGEPADIVGYWDSNDAGIAAHFVVGKDGKIVQCVKLDKIAHHAGFGDEGHNKQYGVEDESRDDKVGTTEIGDWAPDYGMNSYSIGIEMIHVGGEGDYPEAQLKAVDELIAYIDAYYGFESEIIDHKAWRTGNSDTSEEFADYLENYQDHRTHE